MGEKGSPGRNPMEIKHIMLAERVELGLADFKRMEIIEVSV